MRIIIGAIVGLFFAATVHAADFQLFSKGLKDNGKLPPEYTCEKGSHSPDLSWSDPPNGTKAFAFTFTSLDTPIGVAYSWVLYNIPADTRAIPEAADTLPHGTLVGENSLGDAVYYRPCPIQQSSSL